MWVRFVYTLNFIYTLTLLCVYDIRKYDRDSQLCVFVGLPVKRWWNGSDSAHPCCHAKANANPTLQPNRIGSVSPVRSRGKVLLFVLFWCSLGLQMIMMAISPASLPTDPEPNSRWFGAAPVRITARVGCHAPLDVCGVRRSDGLDTGVRNRRNADRPLIDRSFSFCLGSMVYA